MGYEKSAKKGQASVEYLTLYGLAIVLVIVAVAAMYLMGIISLGSRPQACSFNLGISCDYFNTGNYANNTYSTVLLLANTQPYSISNPEIIINSGGTNTSSYICDNGIIPPGSSFLCQINTPSISGVSYAHETIYLSVGDCSLLISYIKNGTCENPPKTTYIGSVFSNVVKLPKIALFVVLLVNSSSVPANNTIDGVKAVVYAYGRAIKNIPVNFSINNTQANLHSSTIVSDLNGSAITYLSSNKSTMVVLTASYEWASANTLITFFPSYTLQFVPYIPQMSLAYTLSVLKNAQITINGKNYPMDNVSLYKIRINNTNPGLYTITPSAINLSNYTTLTFHNVSGCSSIINTTTGYIPKCGHNAVINVNYLIKTVIYTNNCSQGPAPSLTNQNQLAYGIYTTEAGQGSVQVTTLSNGEEINGHNGVYTFQNRTANLYTNDLSIKNQLFSGYICENIYGGYNNLNLNTSNKYTQNTQNIKIEGNINNLTITSGSGNFSIYGNNDNFNLGSGNGNFIIQGNNNNASLGPGGGYFAINGNNDNTIVTSGNSYLILQGNNDNFNLGSGNGNFIVNGNNDQITFSSGIANLTLQGNANTFNFSNCGVYLNIKGSDNKINLKSCTILGRNIIGGGNKINT